ncbi:MAG: class I SAM-dependent methyltransferase [Alphaproteobacteria bacterium]
MNIQTRELSSAHRESFVSQAAYWMPDLINGSAWLEHAPFGFWIVSALRPRMIVELGVHGGFSYSVFCQGVQRLHLAARCFAIDTWRGDEQAGYYGDEVYDAVYSHNRRYDTFSRLIRSDFSDACGEFADGSIDLLHIDGCHGYEAVRRDFETWLPKMSERGVILLHDTAEHANGFGVHRLWEELRSRYPSFEFTHNHGLGVLGVGQQLPLALEDLFHASASHVTAQTIRTTYERLGACISGLHELDTLRQEVRRLEAETESYKSSTSWRLTAPLRRLARLLKSANAVAGELGDKLNQAATPATPGPGAVNPAYRIDR